MTKTYVNKADFLAGITLQPVDFEVDGLGWTQVRGLSLRELETLRDECGDKDIELMVRGAHKGLINPQLSQEEVTALYDGDPDKVLAIGKRVFELSGRGDRKAQDPLAGTTS